MIDFSYKQLKRPNLFKRILSLLPLTFLRHIFFFRETGRWGNFKNPKTFGEKMQWRILHDRREILRRTADRYATRALIATIAARSGLEIRLPRLLSFAATPRELLSELRMLHVGSGLPRRWLIKPNNSSGELVLIEGEPDWDAIHGKIAEWSGKGSLQTIHWLWANAEAQPGFIAEEWIGDPGQVPEEWKIFLVDGEPRYYIVNQRDLEGNIRAHFDEHWNELQTWHHNPARPLHMPIPPPYRVEMDRAAREIARGWDFLRVDLYYASGSIWFGELTPYPSEGLLRSTPGGAVIDDRLGALWKLPNVREVK
jgi:hypothetical protein